MRRFCRVPISKNCGSSAFTLRTLSHGRSDHLAGGARLDAGGSEQAAVEIAAALARAGARALVATEGGRMATALADVSGEMVPLPLASKNPLTLYLNARR